jgi:hypothetical protein
MGRQENAAAPPSYKLREPFEALRVGHGLLSVQQFVDALRAGDMEVYSLPNNCYALMQYGYSEQGRVANILTTVGSMEHAREALRSIEMIAKRNGADVIMSVGHPGWTKLVASEGYTVTRRILMEKTL